MIYKAKGFVTEKAEILFEEDIIYKKYEHETFLENIIIKFNEVRMDTLDKITREGLMKLGWTPPKE